MRNPSSAERLQEAIGFYEDFHWGEQPEAIVRRRVSKAPKVGVRLGEIHSITYRTRKGGEDALWEHEFGEEGGEPPDLVMDQKNRRLHIVGGSYDVEPRGIVD